MAPFLSVFFPIGLCRVFPFPFVFAFFAFLFLIPFVRLLQPPSLPLARPAFRRSLFPCRLASASWWLSGGFTRRFLSYSLLAPCPACFVTRFLR